MENKLIALIVEGSFSDHRKALTGRAAEHDVDIFFAKARADPDVIAGETDNAGADGLAVREISLVGGAVDRVNFHGRRNIESRLLESERHASRASEEVYSNGSCHH